ncbi:hypothetical protein TcWFU_008788 [Taenia crassiceps]|uniref:Uncharacterized protein n=1 Tax=Taenia crassiceps TaxID=6207 RepID=A0ABR4Q3M9_9CEST
MTKNGPHQFAQIVFTAVGILGFLLKFNSQFVYNLLNKATTKWPQKEVQDVVQFVQQYGSGLAIGFIILGLAVAIITLLGLFALLCNNRILVFTLTYGSELFVFFELL